MYYIIHDNGDVVEIAYNANYDNISEIDTTHTIEEITKSEFEEQKNNLANLQYDNGLKVV